MSDRAATLGIVGAGTVVSSLHLPVLVNMPDVRVVWVCDSSIKAARAMARSYLIPKAYDRLSDCPDVDVVLVTVPVGARRQVVPEVLARGWHTFCEKPFALTLAEHDEFLADACRHGVQIGVGLVRRFAGPTVTARQFLRRRFLGPLVRISAAEGVRMRRTGKGSDWYMANPAAGGGVLIETGTHLLDQVLYMLDARDITLIDSVQRTHLGIELASCLLVEVESATEGIVECRAEVSVLEDLCNGIFIEFANYVLKVGLFFEDSLTLIARDGTTLCEFSVGEGARDIVSGFHQEWQDFLRQCRTGEPSIVAASTVRQTTVLTEACYARAKAVDLRQ